MSHQIAVPIQNSEIIALATYHFPAPYRIEYNAYDAVKDYVVVQKGQEIYRFPNKEEILSWLEKQRAEIQVHPKISNIVFLRDRYEAEAIKIYGTDLDLIGAEMQKIPTLTYASAEDILDACTPNYEF